MNSWSPVLVAAFWANAIRIENGCLEWSGFRDRYGYGRFRKRRPELIDIKAHRAAFWLTHGVLPPLVRHTCDNPPCIDPQHLLAGDHASNAHDAIARNRFPFRPRKLPAALERKIRAQYAAGGCTYRGLAREYDLSYGLIQNVLTRSD